ncbi:MAG: aminoacetone oxidase family FAD-binding enzyme, partial [Planctomycetes bacterium]|nr:aminoacetone oxidase family FAD-binding enzyme [Planctomycetota bacterium]
HGLETKVEFSGCVFPITDRATDVKNVLLAQAKLAGVRFVYGRRAYPVEKAGSGFVVKGDADSVKCRAVIIATGGVSWPKTGSTGDGFGIAASFGHEIIARHAALVPLVAKEKWCKALSGIGIEEVEITLKLQGSKIISEVGPMMFTHDGIGGPAVFDLSRRLLGVSFKPPTPLELSIDMLVGLDEQELKQKLIALCKDHPKKGMSALLCEFFPKALSEQLCRMAGCADTMGSHLSKDKRDKLLNLMKKLTVNIVSARPIEEATVTRGGVDTSEIDPTTMQSKLCPGLFFAGEVMNVDGPCGGYNLQIAWSTGALAGQTAANLPADRDLAAK